MSLCFYIYHSILSFSSRSGSTSSSSRGVSHYLQLSLVFSVTLKNNREHYTTNTDQTLPHYPLGDIFFSIIKINVVTMEIEAHYRLQDEIHND